MNQIHEFQGYQGSTVYLLLSVGMTSHKKTEDDDEEETGPLQSTYQQPQRHGRGGQAGRRDVEKADRVGREKETNGKAYVDGNF